MEREWFPNAMISREQKVTEPQVDDILTLRPGPTLRDMLAPLFRRMRTFIYTFSGVILGTILAAFVFNSIHKGTMEILVNEQRLDPSVTSQSTQGQATVPGVSDYDIGSEIELLKSPDLLQKVVLANNLQKKEKESFTAFLHPGKNDDWWIARATQKLGGKLDITAVSKANLVEVDYKATDPTLAYNVLHTLAGLYLEKHNSVHRPQGSYSFFATQTDKYQQALSDSVERLADFSKTTGLAAPDVERTDLAQQVTNAVGALETARQSMAADKNRIRDEMTRMKVVPERSLSQESEDSAQALMQQLQADLLTAEDKKTQLLMKYEPTYPLVQEADQEIAETRSAILSAEKQKYVNRTTDRDPTFELMREDVAKTEADLAFHQASAAALENSIHGLQMQMVDLDQKALKQADLLRDAKANESNYLLYLSKREQERTSDALDEKRIANVAIAVPPLPPVLPWISPIIVLLCGMVLAPFLAAGAAFVAEYLDPSLRTPTEVLDVLRIPVLASVPKQTA
jgi:polysaccharide biosynthesis transport protein